MGGYHVTNKLPRLKYFSALWRTLKEVALLLWLGGEDLAQEEGPVRGAGTVGKEGAAMGGGVP